MSFTPEHLLRSLESLRKICLSAIAGHNQIDDRELLSLSRSTLAAVNAYNQQHNISELALLCNDWPRVHSFERQTSFHKNAQLIYYIVLVPIIFILIYSPFAALLLGFLWTGAYGITLLFRWKRNLGIQSQMKRIAELCGAIAMVIRSHESYQ
jgi:hypothetical protein